jgi:hypothetical protein
VGLLVGYNILAVMIGTGSGWWGFFQYGWPIELLLVALFLFLLMAARSQIWLLIPAGILAGNGLLMAVTSLTGFWGLWAWLWPAELLLVGGVIILTINLARRHSDGVQKFARALGTSMAMFTGVLAGVVAIGSVGASILHALFR